MKKIVLTCIGGAYVPFMVSVIRQIKTSKFEIIGLDRNLTSNGVQHIFDGVHRCPDASQHPNEYREFVKAFCEKEQIDGFIPLSENEIDALIGMNEDMPNTRFLIPTHEQHEVVNNKLRFMELLKQNGLEKDPLFEINNIDDFRNAANSIGYPDTPIVVKPRQGSGSRGVLIADAREATSTPVPGRLCAVGPISFIEDYIAENKMNLNGYLATPFYGHNVCDVDCYAYDGQPAVIIPRKREYTNPLSPTNEGFLVIENKRIEEIMGKVCALLKITGPIDVDIAIDSKNEVHIIDVAFRISGSAAATMALGFNYLEYVLLGLFGERIDREINIQNERVRPIPSFVKVK